MTNILYYAKEGGEIPENIVISNHNCIEVNVLAAVAKGKKHGCDIRKYLERYGVFCDMKQVRSALHRLNIKKLVIYKDNVWKVCK